MYKFNIQQFRQRAKRWRCYLLYLVVGIGQPESVFLFGDGNPEPCNDLTALAPENRQTAAIPIKNPQTLIHIGNADISGSFPSGIVICRQKALNMRLILSRKSAPILYLQDQTAVRFISPY